MIRAAGLDKKMGFRYTNSCVTASKECMQAQSERVFIHNIHGIEMYTVSHQLKNGQIYSYGKSFVLTGIAEPPSKTQLVSY